MENINLLAIDLAKDVFQFHAENQHGKCVLSKKVTRTKLMNEVCKLPNLKTIAMEACGGANYWARRFQELGYEVKMISPQYVKPFVKTNKNDRNDAKAIAIAARQESMNFVSVKSVEQQSLQTLLRTREYIIKEKTAISNRIRGYLLEFGITIPKGINKLKSGLMTILDEVESNIPEDVRLCLQFCYEQLTRLIEKQKIFDAKIAIHTRDNPICQRLSKIPGIGPVSATTIYTVMGSPAHYKNGRHFAAFLGLVPRQNSSGGKQQLLGISKRGNTYLRQVLIHGARAVIRAATKKSDRLSIWLNNLVVRRGVNRAAVALANKNARIAWALLAKNLEYQCAV